MAGRKPLPTRLKILRGNPGKRPLNKAEPRVPVLTRPPAPPRFLDRRARAEWRRVARLLVDANMITPLDRAGLVGYCISFSRIADIERQITDGDAKLISVGAEGGDYVNPLINIQAGFLKQMKAFASEFGMTPSSRARVKVPDKPKQDPFEAFLTGQSG